MMNYIWVGLVAIAVITGIFTGNRDFRRKRESVLTDRSLNNEKTFEIKKGEY